MNDERIVIPNPCKENWDNMTPNNEGKHCAICSKTVVDFTSMTLDQIKDYFDNRKTEKVCGHFKATHVLITRPKHHQYLIDLYAKIEQTFTIPLFKTVSLSLIALCMTIVGCNDTSTGDKMPKQNIDSVNQNLENRITGDTIYPNQIDTSEVLTGEVCIKKDTVNTK